MALFQLNLFDTVFRKKTVRRKPVINSNSHSALELKQIWGNLIDEYYPNRQELKEYQLCWSRRSQKYTLASCNIGRKKVNVARELSHDSLKPWLEAVIYHELCHAVIGAQVERKRGKRKWHGPQFKALEARHPGIIPLHIWIKSGGWSETIRLLKKKAA